MVYSRKEKNPVRASGKDGLQFDPISVPLYTSPVDNFISDAGGSPAFPQYGLLGTRTETADGQDSWQCQDEVFANMNNPWSAFICGAQGAGKSHTLSRLLENALLPESPFGKAPQPLTGMVFHYDTFGSTQTAQPCEAAFLGSCGIKVRVLVSPTNEWAMREVYTNLPGYPPEAPAPEVVPFYLSEEQLSISRILTLMAVHDDDRTPLYMESLCEVLRTMALERQGAGGVDYGSFRKRLSDMQFSPTQNAPLRLRLQLLESFLAYTGTPEEAELVNNMWRFDPGTLTILDLSCPFISQHDACAIFSICLSIFMDNRHECGRIIALDEAHKFLSQSTESAKLTEALITIIRQQRHLATRVLIATQEPTLSPQLLDLCDVSVIHLFRSPAWYQVLRNHLAGVREDSFRPKSELDIFQQVLTLGVGEALIFCPTAIYDVGQDGPVRATYRYIRLQVREGIATDGGLSITAADKRIGEERVGQERDRTKSGLQIRPYKMVMGITVPKDPNITSQPTMSSSAHTTANATSIARPTKSQQSAPRPNPPSTSASSQQRIKNTAAARTSKKSKPSVAPKPAKNSQKFKAPPTPLATQSSQHPQTSTPQPIPPGQHASPTLSGLIERIPEITERYMREHPRNLKTNPIRDLVEQDFGLEKGYLIQAGYANTCSNLIGKTMQKR